MTSSFRIYWLFVVVFSSIPFGQVAANPLDAVPCSCELITVPPNPKCDPANNFGNIFTNLHTAICKTLCIFYPALTPVVGECCRNALDKLIAGIFTVFQKYAVIVAGAPVTADTCCLYFGISQILTIIATAVSVALPDALKTHDFGAAITFIENSIASCTFPGVAECAIDLGPDLVDSQLKYLKSINITADWQCCLQRVPDYALALL